MPFSTMAVVLSAQTILLLQCLTLQVLYGLAAGMPSESLQPAPPSTISLEERFAATHLVEDMYSHGFESYMVHAFPDDELRPLSCDGRRIKERGDLDAILGNYSMTLIDSLDSLVVFRRYDDFKFAVNHISNKVNFDQDVEVSTFEVNIRALGGLLSGHLHAMKVLDDYNDGLLHQALDLAGRLAKAFETPTGLPLPRVNLRHGLEGVKSTTVTVAEAGSFLLEFGVLSLLTADASYYNLAKKSALTFWRQRSSLDLLGTTIDVKTGQFTDSQSTTGPGQDSFYEYLLKGYILFDDLELLEMFQRAYAALEQFSGFEGFTYNIDMYTGLMTNSHLSPLSCVWASLQVLAGDASGALRTVLYWYELWGKHKALPEVFDTKTEAPTNARDSPLRPELIEAIFYLSRAMPDDPFVFRMAKEIANAINDQSRVTCGFASVADVTTKRLDDRMDSFFLSETLVYLYLTLAAPEELARDEHWHLPSVVFSTEGHIFPLAQDRRYATSRIPGVADHALNMFPSTSRPMLGCAPLSPFERVAVQQRCRTKYVLTPQYQVNSLGHAPGRCRPQQVTVLVHDSERQVLQMEGFASSFGPQFLKAPNPTPVPGAHRMVKSTDTCGAMSSATNDTSGGPDSKAEWSSCSPIATTSMVNPIWSPPRELGLPRLDLDEPPGQMPTFSSKRKTRAQWLFSTRRVVEFDPLDACSEFNVPADANEDYYAGRIVVVSRGNCLFLQKIQNMQKAGAAGAIVVNNEEHTELQVMTCPLQERGAGRDLHVPSLMVSHQDGSTLLELLRAPGGEKISASVFAPH